MNMAPGSSCTLSEAATAVGRAESTVRFWLQKKLVIGSKASDGSWLIDRNSLLQHAAAAEPLRPQSRRSGATTTAVVTAAEELPMAQLLDALRDQVAGLNTTIQHERRVAEDLRTQNRELQSQLVKLAAEMQAILSKDGDGMLSRWFRK